MPLSSESERMKKSVGFKYKFLLQHHILWLWKWQQRIWNVFRLCESFRINLCDCTLHASTASFHVYYISLLLVISQSIKLRDCCFRDTFAMADCKLHFNLLKFLIWSTINWINAKVCNLQGFSSNRIKPSREPANPSECKLHSILSLISQHSFFQSKLFEPKGAPLHPVTLPPCLCITHLLIQKYTETTLNIFNNLCYQTAHRLKWNLFVDWIDGVEKNVCTALRLHAEKREAAGREKKESASAKSINIPLQFFNPSEIW